MKSFLRDSNERLHDFKNAILKVNAEAEAVVEIIVRDGFPAISLLMYKIVKGQ